MRLLLDTNAVLWWLRDNPRLGQKARLLIADNANEVLVSVVSPWEITMKYRIGKLEERGAALWTAIEAEGFTILPISYDHFVALDDLPTHHKDPFDHMILAQACVENAAIITSDREMTLYGVPCIPAVR
jgi:PIN domain nuclease of toxin-antitoxin system